MEGSNEAIVDNTASTGGESAELSNTEVLNQGADQGNEGNEGQQGDTGGSEGDGVVSTPVEPASDPVNKRFSELTRREREARASEREARDQLNKALDALNRATGGRKPEAPLTPETPADDLGAEPEAPEFLDPEQYQRDMAVYAQQVASRTAKMTLRAEAANRQREDAERSNREKQIAHMTAWQNRRQKAMDEMPDYADVAESPDVTVTQTMAIAVTSSEHGPKLAYYLGQHPEIAERIAKMPDALQLMEMGKLEMQISAPKKLAVSKAPAPVKPSVGSGEPQAKSLDEMSMDEYVAQRKH